MSDETTPPEGAETPATEPATATARTSFRPENVLQRKTDAASRPGFRDPPNNTTKAHNKKKRK